MRAAVMSCTEPGSAGETHSGDPSAEAVRDILMPGDPAPLQQAVFEMTLPQPGGYMTDSLDVPPVTDIGLDAAYILCDKDTALARPGPEFSARLGIDPLLVPGNHMTMFTRPAAVADTLAGAL
jgi:hypothetical protein